MVTHLMLFICVVRVEKYISLGEKLSDWKLAHDGRTCAGKIVEICGECDGDGKVDILTCSHGKSVRHQFCSHGLFNLHG